MHLMGMCARCYPAKVVYNGSSMKKVVVVGTGYVGLVTGTCFAEVGNTVVCVDIDEQKIAQMQHGEVPIYEPGLEELFTKNIAASRLHFTTDLAAAVNEVDVIFLALPTPPGEDGSADLSYVLGVAEQLGPLLNKYTVIVDKSTVPVGTAELVRANIAAGASVTFDVVSNPEFLREGLAISDFMHPDRVVLGVSAQKARAIMQELYEPIVADGQPIYFMDERSAELTKYAANSFLALKITFMNEIANLCERVGADVDAVRQGIGSDERIGHRFLYAGIGYGGSCFPKDVQALLHTSSQHDYAFKLLETVIGLNTKQQHVLTEKALRYYGDSVKGKTFALWGLAFKANTDDIRQSPALVIIQDLLRAGARVQVYDPEAMRHVQKLFGDDAEVSFAKDQYAALQGADALFIATDWKAFKDASLARIASELNSPVVFDGRNIFSLEAASQAGIRYESIGRATIEPHVF